MVASATPPQSLIPFRGRILVVSNRDELITTLDTLIREEGHLTLAVPNGEEALSVFEEGAVPDVVISDLSCDGSLEGIGYVRRFRQLNQLGHHMVIVEDGAPFTSGSSFAVEPFRILQQPLEPEQVRESVTEAMNQIRFDLQALRGEMFREAARLQRAIRDAQLEMVTAMAMTMEAKDPYMRGHCSRVAELAQQIAETMGVEREEVETLYSAAMLHEIGKIGMPLDLLHKTTALTPDELEEIRSHTRVGAQIVRGVPSLRRLAPLIENQYSAYADLPGRLSPTTPEFLLSSILRVADTYDAMISDRSYRSTLPREVWEAALRNESGSQFHPDVVDAFFRVVAPKEGAGANDPPPWNREV
jgi:putative two-component system response regulator